MESRYKWPLANFCYAGICFVLGGLLAAIGAANENALAPVGGLILLIGVAYVLAGLWHLSQALMASDDEAD